MNFPPQPLYPAIEPYAVHSLQVDSSHVIYLEESGNPLGQPIVFIHGGPGSGTSPIQRQFFDPEHYRIILFDQRGCGKSRPHACLTNNTSAHLVEDMERIRQYLKIDQWLLFGGSWGSTLALLYAQAFPERVLAMVLRGIFLCRPEDTAWFYQQGANRFFPEYWQDFVRPIPEDQQHDMISAYYALLTSDNEIERMRAAEAWSVWEARTSTLKPNTDLVNDLGQPHHALAMARIECHYFIHHAFIEDNQILARCDQIHHLPITLIQGRYDMVCPMNQAQALSVALPQAKFIICEQAGHSAFETEISQQLVAATDFYRDTLD